MKRKVVIVGGGFGGLVTGMTLIELLKSDIDITLIDKIGVHSYRPSIHEIISGKIKAKDIEIPLRVMLKQTDIRLIQDEVVSVDSKKRIVETFDHALKYDYLVLCCGATNNLYGVEGAKEYAYLFRTPEDAEKINTNLNHLLADRKHKCNIIILGGGTEGVEVAGELIDLIKKSNYRDDFSSVRITVKLVHGKDRILPEFTPQAQEFVTKYLLKKGINIITNNRITKVLKNKVELKSGKHLNMSILIWTGGIKPAKLIQEINLSKDPNGWLKVTEQLHSPDDKRVFGVGDIMNIYSKGKYFNLPRLAYHAQDQALVAGMNIYYQIKGKKLIPYYPKQKPQLISIGEEMGILTQGGYFTSGQWVVLAKKIVERYHLISCFTKPILSPLTTTIPGTEFINFFKALSPI
jgi:NADH dehydrogenase